MLGAQPGRRRAEYLTDCVVFDLETTGLSCTDDRIVEIAGIKVLGGEERESFATLVNPERPISWGASQMNGITDELVADAPTIAEALPRFLAFAGDLPLVGHNIHSFDMHFLHNACAALYEGQVLSNDYVDTLPLARRLVPELSHHRLTDLAAYFRLSTEGAHRALADTRMNLLVYERLGERLAAAPPIRLCPKCGEPLVERNGKFGRFLGCQGFPRCRYTERLS